MESQQLCEEAIERSEFLKHMGFIDGGHFNEYRDAVINGLVTFGSPFEKSLGSALSLADLWSSVRILRYWQQECEHASLLWKMKLAKEKAERSFEL